MGSADAVSSPLRILLATEYLPPYVSGIANRCKYLAKGYREAGHIVTIYSVEGSECDKLVPSLKNVFYPAQRMFMLPPLDLLFQLLDFSTPLPYDIVHVVTPLCFPFIPLMPLFYLRGIKIYVSYHVAMQKYKDLYLGEGYQWLGDILEIMYVIIYFWPLVFFASAVGVPSGAADTFVFSLSKRVHYMKSGLDTDIYAPRPDDGEIIESEPLPPSLLPNAIPSRQQKSSTTLTNRNKSIHSDTSTTFPSEQGPLLVYVGRLAVEKNIQFLIEALNEPQLLNAKLVIVGDGPWRVPLEDLARDTVGSDQVFSGHKMGDDPTSVKNHGKDGKITISDHRIQFVGMIVKEQIVAQYYAAADVFISASSSETFGFTVVEAMSCGTPAVVVRSGSFPRVFGMIREWMFEDGDTQDYVNKVISVWKDGKQARRISRRIVLNEFSIKSAVKDLLHTYKLIVEDNADVLDKALDKRH
ncbi:Sulfoquinovosyl transferase sqd2 [Nowakowskiella sp. JEL0407]|nr:Sulfoquinovosyl transferase sqd2 [Nowakowskiella sp. JEL0407]